MSADSTPDRADLVDTALACWRQGDCALGEHWFVSRFDVEMPISSVAKAAATESDLAEEEVPGFVVVSQTCDIVKSCLERPFVEVSPLVEVDARRLREIERGHRPAYAFIPGLATRGLVADLDRTMTMEKPVLAKWVRVSGCASDVDVRVFAYALVRKRARFAFPDDFARLAHKIQERLIEKHDRQSDEGRSLRALKEIRVQATPSWDADSVALTFWFILGEDQPDFDGKRWETWCHQWMALVPAAGRFARIDGAVTTLSDMTAATYLSSDPLDLDHLSLRAESL